MGMDIMLQVFKIQELLHTMTKSIERLYSLFSI